MMTIAEFDLLSEGEKRDALLKCCGSTTWANLMLAALPVANLTNLLQYADETWAQCSDKDYLEAFKHHPKIGDKSSLKEKFASTATWA